MTDNYWPQDQRDIEARDALQDQRDSEAREALGPFQQDQEIKTAAERLAKVLFGDVRSVDCDIIASHMARVVARLTESLRYYSDYANVCAREVIEYQKRIRELEAQVEPVAKLVTAMQEVLRISDRKHHAWDAAKEAIGALARPATEALGAAKGELSDAEIQAAWDVACQDSPSKPGWCRHIRFARAILAIAKDQS